MDGWLYNCGICRYGDDGRGNIYIYTQRERERVSLVTTKRSDCAWVIGERVVIMVVGLVEGGVEGNEDGYADS